MGVGTGRLSRWTRYFTVASALALVGVQAAALAGVRVRLVALATVFGFVCPMIFGMGYLLLPSLVGRTLANQRLPGLHLAVAFLGAGCLLAQQFYGLDSAVLTAGVVLWSLGVALFLGLLARTTVPAVLARPEVVVRSADRPQRSTRLATAMIPVALGYLAVGTLGLLGRVALLPAVVPAALPRVLHYYAAGLGALLIFALGARLIPGFFHVTPPRWLTWLVLVAGGLGPALLATHLPVGPWFRAGAALEATAMVGYALLIAVVWRRSAWRRVSFYGIALGAAAGVCAVGVGLLLAFRGATTERLAAHATFVATGFFPLTIAGYAYQFFPVTTGQFPGATERTALASLLLLALGTGLRALGYLASLPLLQHGGALLALGGAAGYAYLVGRRLLFSG